MSYLTDAPIDTAALIRRVMRPSDGAYVLFDGAIAALSAVILGV